MATESSLPPPPPSGGGAAKYVVILLILLMGGVGIWLATRSNEEPVAAPPPPPKVAQRDTSLGDEGLVIPEDEEEVEDAGEPEQPEVPPKKKRRPSGTGGGAWSCSGDLAPAAIRKVITGSYSTIRACYERRLKNANMLQGSLNLQVKVGADGKVVATRIRGSLNDAQVRSCVQGQAKTWTFPAPSGGCVIFDAPYNFTPKP